MFVQAVVEIAAGQGRFFAVIHNGTHLPESGNHGEAGQIGVFLEQILQGLRIGQRVIHDMYVLHGLIAQKMHFRADFADADHVALSDQVFPGGGVYPHAAAGDEVEGRQRLSHLVDCLLSG